MGDLAVLVRLGRALLDVVDPLRLAVQSPQAFEALLRREGWQPPPTNEYFATVSDAFKLAGALEAAATALEAIADGDSDEGAIAGAIDALAKVIVDLRALPRPTGTLPAPFDLDDFWTTFCVDLVADLFSRYVELAHPRIFAPLHLMGILDEETVDPAGAPSRIAFVRHKVVWGRLVTLVSDPASLAADVYGWGGSFAHDKLLQRLARVLVALGVPAGQHTPDAALSAIYYGATPPPDTVRLLRVPLLETHQPDVGFVKVGLLAMAIPPAADLAAAPVGLFVGPYAIGQAAASVELGGPLALELKGGLESGGSVGLELRPGAFAGRLGAPGTDFDIEAALALEPQTPFLLLGSAGSHRVQLGKSRLGLALSGPVASPELQLALQFDSLQLVFDPTDGDSFLTELFGTDPKTAEASGGLVWSSKTGLHVTGEAKLDLTLPLNQTLGPLTIQAIRATIEAGTQDVSLALAITGGARIGPIQASVKDVGVKLSLVSVTPPARGTFGDLDIQFGFKPPSGVGLAIDVAGLVGGGFLEHDEARQEYGGVLQLEFLSYKLSAFGLLATVLPTGPGYSLVAMVDAQFPPIQLGLGFTLAGAGGLLGVHRTASVDALRAGLAAHTLSNLLFPKNPIANAPQLLTELDTLFPAAAGRFLFGPLVRIDWGTPALVTIDLALLLELPEPVRIVLISEIAVLLPTPTEKLVEIHISALGTIDFGASEGALDAVLHDSRLMKFTLHGAMALRVNWSSQKTFLLSVGGFHPKFQPPPNFPKLDRVGISMAAGAISKLNLDGYFAISSNSLQIGAAIDLFVGVDGFGIAGNLAFDTLIQRHPFHFDGDISGSIALSVDGHDLMALSMKGALTGPAPWNANGSVSFDVLWWSVTKSFSETFGDSGDAPAPAQVDVGQLLRTALADARNFSSVAAAGLPELVTLRAPAATDTLVVLRPGAALSVHQTVVPLGLSITQYAGAAPSGESRFDITTVAAGGTAQGFAPVMDDFAPAQFLALSDDDKLASPSFERFSSGASVAGGTTFGAASARVVAYETWLADTSDGPLREDGGLPTPLPVGVFAGWLLDGIAGRSTVLRSGAARYAGTRRDMTPAAPVFVVANSDTLTAAGVADAAGQTYRQARDVLAAQLAQHPDQAGTLMVVAQYEVAA